MTTSNVAPPPVESPPPRLAAAIIASASVASLLPSGSTEADGAALHQSNADSESGADEDHTNSRRGSGTKSLLKIKKKATAKSRATAVKTTKLIDAIRDALRNADRQYFVAGDGILTLMSVRRFRSTKPLHSYREIAKMIGLWHPSFLSKLATVSRMCDAETRKYALKQGLGWQNCYDLCVIKRNEESEKPMLDLMKERAARVRRERSTEPRDATELLLGSV